jgi:putative transposase
LNDEIVSRGNRMTKKQFTEEQIGNILRQVEGGVPAVEICERLGITEETLSSWKSKHTGTGAVEHDRLKQLEEENRKLKLLVVDLSLDKQMLQDVLKKTLEQVKK